MGEITPIHRAAMKGDVAALRRELEAGVPPDQHTRGGYTTPLHYVMCANSWEFGAGHVACVKLLLAAGASPNVSHVESWLDSIGSGDYNNTPLHCAARLPENDGRGNHKLYVDIVKLLLAAGADVNAYRFLGSATTSESNKLGLLLEREYR